MAKEIYGSGASYPAGVTNIAYASYLEISKYKYNAGLKAAYANGQRDVAASFGQSGLAQSAKDVVNNIGQTLFGGIDPNDYDLNKFNEDLKNDIATSAEFEGENRNQITKDVMAGDYTHLFKDGNSITLQNGDVINNAEQLLEIKKEAQRTVGNDVSIFNLPMPQEFSYNYSADWSNEFKMGTMARAMDDLAGTLGQMLVTGTATAATKSLQLLTGVAVDGVEQGSGLSNVTDVLGSAFEGAVNPLGSTDELNVNRILGLAGLAPNENAINFFKKIQNRKFNLSFDFFARDPNEADNIDKIIYAFKGGMHPTATMKGTGGVLGFPDLFTIKPMFVQKNEGAGITKVRHPMMPKSKLCALTDLQINTSPSNNFVTTKDGKIPLQSVTMMFEEITAMTQSDIKAGDF
tara:strand:- start:9919 stop:11133 length:1215 start_codon:yes stop_codon:yes gene_type:complete